MGLISRVSSRTYRANMSFIAGEEFQHIHRIQNTNIDGNVKALYAMTKIRGIGRRFSDLVLKKSEIDRTKRARQLTSEEIERMQTTMANPKNFKLHRGIRHYWGVRVKGQHTCTTGRHGRTVGIT